MACAGGDAALIERGDAHNALGHWGRGGAGPAGWGCGSSAPVAGAVVTGATGAPAATSWPGLAHCSTGCDVRGEGPHWQGWGLCTWGWGDPQEWGRKGLPSQETARLGHGIPPRYREGWAWRKNPGVLAPRPSLHPLALIPQPSCPPRTEENPGIRAPSLLPYLVRSHPPYSNPILDSTPLL